jgi:hypothetical protein
MNYWIPDDQLDRLNDGLEKLEPDVVGMVER